MSSDSVVSESVENVQDFVRLGQLLKKIEG